MGSYNPLYKAKNQGLLITAHLALHFWHPQGIPFLKALELYVTV